MDASPSTPTEQIRQRQGEAIREAREARDMTIGELADLIGASPGSVSHWENGRHSPRLRQQLDIAVALRVTWVALFGLDDA